jgi:glucose/arabinose dehydrogenase
MTDRRTFLAAVAAIGVGAVAGCKGTGEPIAHGPASVPTSRASSRVEPRVARDVVAGGLNVPWGIAFLPDGRALVAQRDVGSVVVVDPKASGDDRVQPFGDVRGAIGRAGGEGGLLGLALDPQDETSLFAYVTTSADDRVVRLDIGDGKVGTSEPILTGIPVGERHHGGRIAFGPDDHLYVGTGEAGRPELAQDPDSLGGKILRLTRDGEVEWWSRGHRNVEGLAFDADGRLWACEFGHRRFDELNLIERGANYGWPEVEGDADDDRFVRPKVTWPTAECSPSGLAITRSTAFVAALRGERLWEIPLAGERVGRPRAHFVGAYGRLRTVVPAPDGSLWLTTSNTDGRGTARNGDDRILRVTLG